MFNGSCVQLTVYYIIEILFHNSLLEFSVLRELSKKKESDWSYTFAPLVSFDFFLQLFGITNQCCTTD